MHLTGEVDVLIYLVGENDHVGIFGKHLGETLQFLVAVDAAGRVRRGVEHNHPCLGSDSLLKLFGSDLEITFHSGIHLHGYALGKFHHLDIAYPRRHGNNHLVARIDAGEQHVAKLLLRTVSDHDLFGSELNFIFTQKFPCNSLP